jgi:hypothetical protein
MGKSGGRTTTKEQAENLNAVSMETEDPPTETYLLQEELKVVDICIGSRSPVTSGFSDQAPLKDFEDITRSAGLRSMAKRESNYATISTTKMGNLPTVADP